MQAKQGHNPAIFPEISPGNRQGSAQKVMARIESPFPGGPPQQPKFEIRQTMLCGCLVGGGTRDAAVSRAVGCRPPRHPARGLSCAVVAGSQDPYAPYAGGALPAPNARMASRRVLPRGRSQGSPNNRAARAMSPAEAGAFPSTPALYKPIPTAQSNTPA